MPYCELEDAERREVEREARGLASLLVGVPLPSRTRPGPPLDPEADWAAFVDLVHPLLRAAPEELRLRASDFAARLTREPAPLDVTQAIGWVGECRTACPTLGAQTAAKEQPAAEARAILTHLARWLVARSGAPALIACLDALEPRLADAKAHIPWSLWLLPSALAARSALVAAPEAEYDAAVAACRRRAEGCPDRERVAYLAYVLGDDRPDADHELRGLVQLPLYTGVWPHFRPRWRVAPFAIDLPPSQAAPFLNPSELRYVALEHVSIDEVATTVVVVAAKAEESPLPVLAWLLGETQGAEKTAIAKAILATGAEDALATLLPFLGSKLVRDALDAADATEPGWMLPACLAAMDGKGASVYRPRVEALLTRHGAGAARAWVAEGSPTIVGRLDRLITARDIAFAPRETWPVVLRDPPWRRKTRRHERPVLEVAPIPKPFAHGLGAVDPNAIHYRFHSGRVLRHLIELPGFIAEAEAASRGFDEEPRFTEPLPDDANGDIALAWLRRRLEIAINPYKARYVDLLQGMIHQPEPLALVLWEAGHLLVKCHQGWRDTIPFMIARFGAAAMPGLGRLAMVDPTEFMPRVQQIDAGEIAPAAAQALKVKRARPEAAAWLRTYSRTAAMRLLPDSLGPAGPARDAADAALHLIASAPEGRAELDAAIAAYTAVDPRVRDAVAAGVDSDPLEQAPRKAPNLPNWIIPSALARPRLASGDALPDDAVRALCEMLLFSSPLAPYAGIAQVRAACLPDSLDAFAMDLFRAWLAAGGKAVSEWAMWASVQIGGAACARDLTRQIRVWASERAKPKALNGLEVLAAMGTDVALMNLNAIAEKSPYAALRELARELIQKLAEARGLGLDELADRLVPDLGLDERGGLDLSFGPRAFRVGFDEMLRPWVRDAAGQRLAALPRPAKADDAVLAKAASRRWTGLKKDVEAVAGLQVSRLETMMASQRRVTPDVFWAFLAAHPLMRHLAGRLVWGVFDGAAPRDGMIRTFRIAEDMSLTDADDRAAAALDLGADSDAPGLVGPVHPLHLGAEALARWSALFSDYEIAQPFPQLGRETFALDESEAASPRIMRFDGERVAGVRLRGLRPQGWTIEGDSQAFNSIRRAIRLPEGAALAAELTFEDGLARHPAAGDGIQTLRALRLQDDGRAGTSATRRFGDLDAVTASEVLRTPSLLVAAGVS